MRDDSQALFQRYVDLSIEIRLNGQSVERTLRKAALALALGQADEALAEAHAAEGMAEASPEARLEAARLAALSLCLRAAVLEGEVEGAAGWNPHHGGGLGAAECRLEAKRILLAMPELDPDETGLLRKLQLGKSLKGVRDLIGS